MAKPIVPDNYKRDLIAANERRDPLPCASRCGRAGIIWRRGELLCAECDSASRPVRLTGADIAAALNPPDSTRNVVSARTAIKALERSAGK